ncbi:type II toxin-antitoxin system RelE/ParE family toxin [Rhizobium sp. NFR03]|uniref:type II toxin-antitoxin system RelE/ParE family toxin n=1 Tax=Rhizobium sp. NFR03 TaxID=1566263 RepID=UPI0008C8E0B3|nr:type II toxin-antitoxin system RelE/ParE family toxin [Rhizobium sp. NFR03]SES14107.1 toxin ParE1/3/4 [Rhizobium sp. NFR03]
MSDLPVQFTPEANTDLTELFDYLAPRAGTAITLKYVSDIHRYCLGFALFPERGFAREDLRPGLRVVGFRRRASIVFQVKNEQVTIIRIFHRGRDLRVSED